MNKVKPTMTYFEVFMHAAIMELNEAPLEVREVVRIAIQREIVRESERKAALARSKAVTANLDPIQGDAVRAAIKSQENH